MTNGGAGESAPAMDVTPSQVEMEAVTPSGEPEGGVMATQAMSFSPGRHEEDVTPPGTVGEEGREDSGEVNVSHLVDRPVTAEEVRPDERPRRSATPLPAPAANGAPKTTQALMQMIARQIKEGINAGLAPFRRQVDDIAAMYGALVEEIKRFQSYQTDKNAELSEGVVALHSGIERCATTDTLTAVRGEIGGVRGEVAEHVEGALGRVQNDIVEARKDLAGDIVGLRTDVGDKASRAEVNDISQKLGELKGGVAGIKSSVESLKEFDKARAEALAALGRQVATLGSTIHTLNERVNTVEGAAEDARRELESLRQSDADIRAELEKLRIQVRAVGCDTEELKGRAGGIESTLAEVRMAATAAQTSADAARTEIAGFIPRLKHIEGLAGDMRQVRNLVEQVRTWEGWRHRFMGDLMEIATATGQRELAAELARVMPPRE